MENMNKMSRLTSIEHCSQQQQNAQHLECMWSVCKVDQYTGPQSKFLTNFKELKSLRKCSLTTVE